MVEKLLYLQDELDGITYKQELKKANRKLEKW